MTYKISIQVISLTKQGNTVTSLVPYSTLYYPWTFSAEVSATDLWRGPKYATDFYIVSTEKLGQKLLKLPI